MALAQKQLEQLARQLEERRKYLEDDIRREVRQGQEYKEVGGEVMDPGDSSAADLIIDLGHAEVGRDVAELRAIDEARQRMRSGEYGLCENCGTEIPFARLEVQPAALRCAPCQTIHEKTYADSGRGATL